MTFFIARSPPSNILLAIHPQSALHFAMSHRYGSLCEHVWGDARARTHAHTHIYACTILTTQTKGCDKVSRQRYLANGSRVLRGWPGKRLSPTLCVCACMCVLNLCCFLTTVRDSGLRTISDITLGSHVTTQGHYKKNTGLMITGCTVEGVRNAG